VALTELTKELERVRQGRAPVHEPWLRQVEDWREQFPFRYTKVDGVLKPQTAVEALRDLTASRSEDVIWTTGVGQHQMWAMQYLVCDRPRSFITSGGLGTMGYGLPAAVGAKAARPRCDCRLRRRRRLLPDDVPGARDRRARTAARRRGRASTDGRNGAPVAGDVLRRALRPDPPDPRGAGLRSLRRRTAVPGHGRERGRPESTLSAAFEGRTAVDVRCDPEEKCFPMVLAGAAAPTSSRRRTMR
jgi:hypothetical protein